ncbi:alpha/beta hydrolase [Mycobacterium sp. AZCC_0083]|uniref:alpha/beta hydrolase n=1 Tax=Mycobacterium sp. AZCC_0083 TaxID=2735882 RepID=UPI00160BADDE|nr:alpha/beta hydrolase [Mycobacterium sp. AZCC_0083]MBB5168150.1 pimeloyl-ACP methyl ester carboxylesterase [Mycobacterium sp. AZCC_0083]
MATFVLIHGAADVGWYWHLLEAELRARGHDTVAPDLPCDDDAAGLDEYVDTVREAIGDRTDLVVVGHSLGGFTAPLVADRVGADALVLVAGMIPAPGEPPNDWWGNAGYSAASDAHAQQEGYADQKDDPFVTFYNGVPRKLAEQAMGKERRQSDTWMAAPWPLDAWPAVPTKFVVCRDDRFFPPDFLRRLATERLGVTPDEIDGGHCAALSHPGQLADVLEKYASKT